MFKHFHAVQKCKNILSGLKLLYTIYIYHDEHFIYDKKKYCSLHTLDKTSICKLLLIVLLYQQITKIYCGNHSRFGKNGQ